jgi:hypothetical protein
MEILGVVFATSGWNGPGTWISLLLHLSTSTACSPVVPPHKIKVTAKPVDLFPNCWNMQGFLSVRSVQKRVVAVIRLTS